MTETISELPQQAQPKGIKGWLILPALGTVLAPFLLGVSVFKLIPDYEAIWFAKARLPVGLLSFIGVEAFGNIAFIIGWIAAIVLLISKSPVFPKLFVALAIGQLLFLLGDMIVLSGIFNHAVSDDTIKSVVRGTIAAAIWCPYMMRSKRVKNTFVGKA